MPLLGVADIGIATESLMAEDNLGSVSFYNWKHCIITPNDHPLAQLNPKEITLEKLAEYPIITYHGGFTGRSKIDTAFDDAGLNADRC